MTSEYCLTVRDVPIATLGPAKIPSPLMYDKGMLDTGKVLLCLTHEYDEDLQKPQSFFFEEAGPRRELYFDPGKTKCAIVTCGGLCPGLNDVIRAIVLEAYHAYHTPSVLGIRYGLEGFIPSYRHNVMELTPASVEHIYQFGGTLLGSSRGPQDPAEIVDALERLNVSVLFVIGGDGSMKAASAIAKEIRLRNLRISIIGIPKTIDNDINFVPQSFGFDTAVDKATEAIGCAHVESLGTPNGIGLVKLMGRESGFIAAQAALALREANFVLIPEAPFQLHGEGGLLPALERRLKERAHAVIIAAEGAGQHLLQKCEARDASGNPVLADVGALLKNSISEYFRGKMPVSVKYIDPSYIIRSVPANANDRVYCGFLGQHAVHAAMAGRTEMVVAKIMDHYVHIPLEQVTKKRRKLNIRSSLWRAVLESTGQGGLAGMLPDDDKA
ncbi:MAG TPA: ATP-dependent 6-phosphofructokinase [Candidatus Bilophila faecipullorum]|uniref:ATP-dependent 6-phosphofructokinase n=4 Tax=Bilophila TaxID=35832 RepID=A0A9D1U9Q2_9BACT|nr:ATP-dependent 6-phosphofructokinase [uncultured Bilophila sp.]HIW78435.1 ATP-dependent 6-phosphofructokinase [Candidatus Bilophila faecipullorum]